MKTQRPKNAGLLILAVGAGLYYPATTWAADSPVADSPVADSPAVSSPTEAVPIADSPIEDTPTTPEGSPEADKTESEDKGPTVVNKSPGAALRLTVMNAATYLTANYHTAAIDIEWDLLPQSTELIEMAGSSQNTTELKPHRIILKNSDLGTPQNWSKDIKSPDARKALMQALEVSNLQNFSRSEADTKFLQKWNGFARQNLFNSDEYIAGLVDHHYLSFLLAGKGVRYAVQSPDAKLRGDNPRFLDDEIRWQIILFPVKRGNLAFYRVAIKALLLNPVNLTFEGASQTQVALKADVSFRSSPGISMLRREINDAVNGLNSIVIPQLQKNELTNVASELGCSIQGVLKFVGSAEFQGNTGRIEGVELQDIASDAKLPANKNATKNALKKNVGKEGQTITLQNSVIGGRSSDNNIRKPVSVFLYADMGYRLAPEYLKQLSPESLKKVIPEQQRLLSPEQQKQLNGAAVLFYRIRKFGPEGDKDVYLPASQRVIRIPIQQDATLEPQPRLVLPGTYLVRLDLPGLPGVSQDFNIESNIYSGSVKTTLNKAEEQSFVISEDHEDSSFSFTITKP